MWNELAAFTAFDASRRTALAGFVAREDVWVLPVLPPPPPPPHPAARRTATSAPLTRNPLMRRCSHLAAPLSS
jgi:hypothetical protein